MTRVAINGFGRVGRLALRAGWDRADLEFVHINEPSGGPETAAHLLTFDSVHGRWDRGAHAGADSLMLDSTLLRFTEAVDPGAVAWEDSGVEVVLECSGRFRAIEQLRPYFDHGVGKVIVAAPVKDPRALNVVVGVNDHRYDPARHDVVTAASCTTNCLAPVVKVIHEGVGILHGSITTLHDASLTDAVFEVARPTTIDEVNELLKAAAGGPLAGILGYEERPLVSVDYKDDPRSAIVDALSTRVTGQTQVKILAWYDNEWGYANRMVELAAILAGSLIPA